MLTSIAVLADIHGVLPALRAVLTEPEVADADAIVLLGDIAAGPQPVETLDLLATLGDRAIWIGGNADRELVEAANGQLGDTPDPITPWAAKQLRADQLDLLAALPLTETLTVRGLGQVLCCHATPRDDEEVALVDSAIGRWQEVLTGLPAGVGTVVCGHTHMPFLRLVDRRTVVNPGSIGMPYGSLGAHWAVLGGSDRPNIALRRTVYDAEAAAEEILADSGYAEIGEWVDFFIRSPASDLEALAAFGPRDGRPS